ncbi:hypothetical protein ABPG77_010008, partial [Micractinium sp. CCAP 211/92]
MLAVDLTRSDPVNSPFLYDVFTGTHSEFLNGHFAALLPKDPRDGAPGTEQLAAVLNTVRVAGNLPFLGKKEWHLGLDGDALKRAAKHNQHVHEGVQCVQPYGPGIQQAQGHQLFGVGYVLKAGHRQGMHAHGQGGSTPSSGGGAHPGQVRDEQSGWYQLHVGYRIGAGTLMLRLGGIGAPVLWLHLPHGAVWVMTRQGAGEFEVAPPPAHEPLQLRVHRRVHHGVPKLRKGIDSEVMITVMNKLSARAGSPEEALRAVLAGIVAQMRGKAGSAAMAPPGVFPDSLTVPGPAVMVPESAEAPWDALMDEDAGDEPEELQEAQDGGPAGAAAAPDQEDGSEPAELQGARDEGLAGTDAVAAAAEPGEDTELEPTQLLEAGEGGCPAVSSAEPGEDTELEPTQLLEAQDGGPAGAAGAPDEASGHEPAEAGAASEAGSPAGAVGAAAAAEPGPEMRQLLESLEVTESLGIRATIALVRTLDKKQLHERLRASGDGRTAWDLTHPAVRTWLAADYYAHSPDAEAVRQLLTADELASLEAACGEDLLEAALRMCSGNLNSVHLTPEQRNGAADRHGAGRVPYTQCSGFSILALEAAGGEPTANAKLDELNFVNGRNQRAVRAAQMLPPELKGPVKSCWKLMSLTDARAAQ